MKKLLYILCAAGILTASSCDSFLDVRPEETLAQAREADKRIAEGTATRLTGIPIAHKDIFVTREWASTAAT